MERILEKIDSPRDLKDLPFEELPRLAEEIREFLLDTVYTTGGHLGSNMGVVELTLALHRVFDFSRDRLLFDVSHQCYTHKLLTGRRESFHTL
ncbi:MAG TPA: 1-deoxy-D-xylulose-5-phosphate synthase, partial [Planctomycetes bacterium]|nr:1-deoxy-D-xylulose-5-phosphate synthase [Planctomycetota bacterium]